MPVSHRRIKLTPSFQRSYITNVHDCFRVRVEASEAHLISDAVFAYRMEPLQPGAAGQVAVFDHVCSPVDLADYPYGAPRVNALPPWFRLSFVEYDAATREQALEAYQDIVADVAALIRSLDTAEVLVEQPPIWIGYWPVEPGSSIGSSDGSEG